MRKNIAKVIKLLETNKWVTVDESAQYLTKFFGMEVSKADVLKFALNGSLKSIC